nr:hypothetical protein [Hyphomonas sp. Mor2]
MLPDLDPNALRRIAEFLIDTSDPWWVLGSTAMALIGVDPGEIRDVDLLVSERDAQTLMRKHDLENQADGGTRGFRSSHILKPNLIDRPVEILSGYQIYQDGAWVLVEPSSRLSVRVGASTVFVPDREEQISLLQRLGRPKDLARLALFERSASSS